MTKQTTSAPVVIIGGGIAGCATAFYLAKRGVHALLLEKSTFGFEASGRNAGGVRAQCRDISADRILAMKSIELWQTLDDELETVTEYTQGGTIRLAANQQRLDELAAQSKGELADGLYVEMWNQDKLYRHCPFLASGFIGAKYCPTDGNANPKLVAPAFAAAAERLGARTWKHTEVSAVNVEDGQVRSVTACNADGEWQIETEMVVHTGGPWTSILAQQLGLQVPIVPSRTIIGRTEPMPSLFSEFISSHDAEVYARPDKRGCIHIGAVAQPIDAFENCTAEDVRTYLEKRINLIPALGEPTIEEVWWGDLAMTPDRQPIIGPVEGVDGYLLAAGFSGHGFCLGPIMGKLMSELVIDGQASLPIDAFSVHRFDESNEFGRGKLQGTGEGTVEEIV
ncbi:FAD-binding oxidoreductase [Chloroflexi bacterium TSY]|nr:FAD-binding oxidoreductase [Chloroflexi bacterium TSY]